ncbi:hypothetical protein [Virgibacillus necropolis]|nr:hypothetical protein [Virgibacillus necropolis]
MRKLNRQIGQLTNQYNKHGIPIQTNRPPRKIQELREYREAQR